MIQRTAGRSQDPERGSTRPPYIALFAGERKTSAAAEASNVQATISGARRKRPARTRRLLASSLAPVVALSLLPRIIPVATCFILLSGLCSPWVCPLRPRPTGVYERLISIAVTGRDERWPARAGARAGGSRRTAHEQFAALYDEHVWGVYGFFGYRVKSRADAEDLTQLTFERALRAWSRFDPDRASARTWLMSIASNLLIDHYRRDRTAQHEPIEDHLSHRELTTEDADIGLSPRIAAALEESESVSVR